MSASAAASIAPGDEADVALSTVGPTPALIRLAIEVTTTGALGAQAEEFARKAELAGRRDPSNYPSILSKSYMHLRIVQCLSKTLQLS